MKRIPPKAGQESVWDYPRPPRAEPSDRRVEILFAGRRIVDTRRAVRVLETSHPPTWYVPLEDVEPGVLARGQGTSFCEFKGQAVYWDLRVGDRRAARVAWSYPAPVPAFAILKDHLAFYPGRVDECRVDGETVRSQEGDFYGGWITSDVVGPFKGGAGTWGW